MTAEAVAGQLLTAGEALPPGSWRSALCRPDAPGAELDSLPWARSWPAFLMAVFGDDWGPRQFIANVMGERVPSEGGFLVPERLRSEVMAYVTPPVVRPRAMVLPMASERLGIPVLDNPSQASGAQALGGLTFAVTEPGATVASSNPALGRTLLEARKLAALVGIPEELESDAAGALGDFTSRVVSMGHAWAEDDLFIGGTGAGQPQGILYAGCAKQVSRTNASQAPVAADVASMVSALHPAALAAGYMPGVTDVCWLVSSALVGSWLQMYLVPGGSAATAGAPAALPDWLNLGDGHAIAPSILGLPAFITDHQPTTGTLGDLALVDLRNYLIGDRMELTVRRSARGSGFITDVSNYLFTSRVDGRYWTATPTTTEAAQSVSPVVVLK